MIKLKLSILVWAIGLSMTAFSQTTSSLRAKVLTLNDYPDALRLWELYNTSASVEQKSVIEGNWEFIFLLIDTCMLPKGDSNLLYIQN